nr:asparagine synthase (glutamine-hydrolyzing) [uncultured Carboxylicivirga sp.]
MCGIAGYIHTDQKPIKDTGNILPMLKIQKHRGPDDSGIRAFSLDRGESLELGIDQVSGIDSAFEGVLGFNRLSILDLSANGHQPMVSPDNKVILAFNGEIYNAFSYKTELEAWGYRFKSSTDTEVILALYLKYGLEGMLNRLNGMFAIVIADLSRKELYIARDRFGIKPMYYINTNNTLAFSSELKSFKHLEEFSFELNNQKLDEYLLFRNNLNGTLYKHIESLKPGHYLIYSRSKGLGLKQFFEINDYHRENTTKQAIGQTKSQLEKCLEDSVQSQLMSDVKLGCQLSGGIDSSLVTWLANRNANKGHFESVSIVFDDQRFSEEKYIDIVRDQLGITSHKFLLEGDYYFDHFVNATWHLEGPLNHPNTIGIYKLSQRAKEYVTVLLSGEGADEVFGGYSRFYDISFPFRTRKLLSEVKKYRRQLSGFLNYFSQDMRAIIPTSFMNPTLATSVFKDFNFTNAVTDRRALYHQLNGSVFDKQVKYEIKTYLPDLLIRQDKMSMAHSIENRVPFLDNDLVEHSFTIPEDQLLIKAGGSIKNTQKYLLKKMGEDVFGNGFAFRDKMGFGIPVREFFMDKRFNQYLNDQIKSGIKNRGLFNYELINKWISNINQLRYDELEALWVVVAFETWAVKYFDHENRNTSY